MNPIFASTYGEGAYNTNLYSADGSQSGNTSSTTGGAAGTGSTQGGLLSNTGFDVLAAATLACLIIFTALVVRFWRRPAKNKPGSTNVG